uniref:non-specific serine/threonine protein kinase n=1 Tax=Brassica oleracea var. oleracea TaxID=109376 RepID=A0A0D3ANG7_BRAOL
MYRLPTSCMILFFIFYRFHQILCASSEKEIGRCDALFQCGDVTAGFPFSGRNRPEVCGHPLLRLHCINNITSLIISNQEFYVLKINKTSNTLTLARPDLLGSFCSSTFTKATLPTEIFELSPTYKSVNVFYLCAPFLSYPSSSKCPEIGPISISEKPEYNNTCRESFTVNLPTSFLPEEKELNMTHLESALREGFEVKVNIDENACQECLSSHALCGFDQTFPSGVKCAPLYPPDADDIRRRCSASFSCGDQKDLMYPFWIPGREDCGHPDFKLECNASFAELTIFSVKFRILEMDYSSRVIRLSRSDYISNICPLNPVSAPFDENVIPFSPDTEMLTIYYDCRTELSQSVSTYVGEISCHDDVRSYYVTRNLSSPLLSGVRGLINDFKGICRRNVSIPASRPALDTLERTPTPDNLKKALEEGFDLAFNEDCSLCMVSGGACGYTQISSRFVCYCDGWVHTNICDHLFWEPPLSKNSVNSN